MKTFGKGPEVSGVRMGTYYDPSWITTAFLGWRREGAKRINAIKAGLEAGIILIDTAEIYGSEPLVAKAIQGGVRDELFVATKVWSDHLHRDALKRSLEKSLKRRGVSYVDLYQVHAPNRRIPSMRPWPRWRTWGGKNPPRRCQQLRHETDSGS